MKKLYSVILFALLAVMGASADVWTFNVNITNAVVVRCDGRDVTLSETSNPIEVYDYKNYQILPVDGYAIASVYDTTNNQAWNFNTYADCYQKMSFGDGDLNIDITVIDLNASRTASFTLNVEGDVDEVRAALTGEFTSHLNLFTSDDAHSFEFKFSPEYEPYLKVFAPNGAIKNIYSVQCGKYFESRQAEYLVPLTDGCVVNVEQAYPNDPYTLTFSGDLEAVEYFSINNGIDRQIPEDGKLIVALDDRINLNLNREEYKIESIDINGEVNTNVYSSYDFLVTENPTNVKVNAHPYTNVSVTVNVTDAAAVTFQASYNDVALKDGANTVEVSEKSPYIYIKRNAGCEITSLLINGEPYGDLSYISFEAKEGMVIDIEAGPKNYPYYAIVWVNDATCLPYGGKPYMYTDYYGEQYYLNTGYQQIGLSEVPQQDYISAYGAESINVYLDDVEVESTWGSFYPEVTDNSVVKVFLNAQPVNCKVTFDIDPETDVFVTNDYVNLATEATVDCFNGTVFQVYGGDVTVLCNDEEIKAEETDANGFVLPFDATGKKVYTMVINDPETVISVQLPLGIEGVATDSNISDTRIYNLQGVMVGEDLNQLPAGFYIRGGKKIVK